jgi:DNA-binding MarR family transcriptional regulator
MRNRARGGVARPARAIARVDYRTLADLRYQIRRFLRMREVAARAAGVEPQQYLLLLQVKGLEGRGEATIGALAERLQAQHHGVVQLVDRLARRGMVERRRNGIDRRQVTVALRAPGQAVLDRLARYSVAELKTEGPGLVSSLRHLVMTPAPRRRATAGRRKVPS